MKNISIFFKILMITICFGAASAQAGGDAELGQKANAICQGCHGISDFKMAFPKVYSVPKIGGQSYDYIVMALTAYRDGDRENETMHAIAYSLTDKDIQDLAAYYSASD